MMGGCRDRGILNNFMSGIRETWLENRLKEVQGGFIQSPEFMCGLYYSLLLVSHMTPVFHSIECSTSNDLSI